MGVISNGALWVVLSAAALYWFAVWVLGTDAARDSVDIASIFMGLVLAGRLLPDALDRFMRGGSKNGWQLLLGNVLFLLGWVFFCAWSYVLRYENRPMWMVESPINGFAKYWILGGIVLSYFATSGEQTFRNPSRIYYVSIGLLAGVLIGVAVGRLFLPA